MPNATRAGGIHCVVSLVAATMYRKLCRISKSRDPLKISATSDVSSVATRLVYDRTYEFEKAVVSSVATYFAPLSPKILTQGIPKPPLNEFG